MKKFFTVTMDVYQKHETFSEAREDAEEKALGHPGHRYLVMVPVSSSQVTQEMVVTDLSGFDIGDLK